MLSTNKNPIIDLEDDIMFPPFLLISSYGPAADHWRNMLGLHRKIEEGNVYVQLSGDVDNPYKLFTNQEIWVISYNIGLD